MEILQTIKGIILGHAVADALGVPVEFKSREYLRKNPVTDMMGYGTYYQPKGTWSDDTSMTLCTLESITKYGDINLTDIMKSFAKWQLQKLQNQIFILKLNKKTPCTFARFFYCKKVADNKQKLSNKLHKKFLKLLTPFDFSVMIV